jgi:hypothetical protein
MADTLQNNLSKIEKITKYILMGLIVVFSIRYIPNINLKNEEIMMIGAISSITYAILDMIAPTIKIKAEPKNNSVVEANIKN